MKNRMKQIGLAILMVLPLTGVMAQPGGNGQGKRAQMHDGSGIAMIIPDLTEEQQSKIKELHLNLTKEILPIKNQLGENKAKMKTLQTAEDPDMKAIDNLIDESSKLQADIQKKQAANHQEVRKLLTEEQRVIFDSHAGQTGRMRAMTNRMRQDGLRKDRMKRMENGVPQRGRGNRGNFQ